MICPSSGVVEHPRWSTTTAHRLCIEELKVLVVSMEVTLETGSRSVTAVGLLCNEELQTAGARPSAAGTAVTGPAAATPDAVGTHAHKSI